MATATYGYQPDVDADAAMWRESLVLEHLPQVRLIAKRIHDRLPDYVSLDDLISTGVIGLISAIDNFDPSLNVQLNTYAERKIRGAILDGLRETDWAPREVRKKSRLIEAAIHRAKQRFGREATEEEISAELGIAPAEYQRWLTDVRNVELERLESAGGDGSARVCSRSCQTAKSLLPPASWSAMNWSVSLPWRSIEFLKSSARSCRCTTTRN